MQCTYLGVKWNLHLDLPAARVQSDDDSLISPALDKIQHQIQMSASASRWGEAFPHEPSNQRGSKRWEVQQKPCGGCVGWAGRSHQLNDEFLQSPVDHPAHLHQREGLWPHAVPFYNPSLSVFIPKICPFLLILVTVTFTPQQPLNLFKRQYCCDAEA